MKLPRFLPLFLALAVAHSATRAAEPTLAEVAAKLPNAARPFAVPRNDDEFIAALRVAFADSMEARHERNVLNLVQYLTPQNVMRVLGVFEEFDREGVSRDRAWRAVWVRWGEIDGPGVFDFLLSDATQEKAGHWHFQHAMDGWVAVDPVAAETWLREHPEAPHYAPLYRALVWGWGGRDSAKATAAALALAPNKDELDGAMSNVAETALREGGVARVIAWFDALDGPTKKLAVNHAAWRVKAGDIPTGARWFAAQADQPWRSDSYLRDFIKRFADEQPRAAMVWVISLPLPAGAKSPPGLGTAMDGWTAKDPAAAAAWLRQNADAPWWARAALGYVKQLRKGKDGAAEKFIDGLDDDHRKALRDVADEN